MKLFFRSFKLINLYLLFSKELKNDRIFGLDVLRFFAIITVIIDHGKFIFPEKIIKFHDYIKIDGVTIFFVLSGFLIGGILIRQLEKNTPSFTSLIDFWIKRWFRTLPTYFLILLILTICYYIQDPSFTFEKISKYYYFCQNLFYPTGIYFAESWSLSVEEWFYFTVPLIIFILINLFKLKPKNSIFFTALFILLFVTLLRYDLYFDNDNTDFHHQVIFRLDSIMYGVLGAYINYYYSKYWDKFSHMLFISGILIFLFQKFYNIYYIYNSNITASIGNFYNIVLEYSLTSLMTLLLLPYLSNIKKSKYKIGNTITIISLISYSMYLTHMTLIKVMILKNIPWTILTTNYNIIIPTFYFLYWSLTFIFSIIIYKIYELPITNLRYKLNFNKNHSK
ncbi:acyltransferase family protein [Chryseobacterium gambrini]|uniref:acyltransferase family protein n=1 Tax=Chryseobacterium gambrini TaxID=373672 RepID=UPI0022F1610F|nr:acyltransferase [Chryseobacterium gambrini]WBV53859.1 acyltransferase [Chryseobacterium gambrini]